MYYTEKIQLNQAADLLEQCGLSMPEGVDCTVGVFDDADGSLVATGSIKGDMLQGMAVDPNRQGEDLTGKVMTALLAEAKNAQTLYLFTKPAKAHQFTGLGFRLVAKARPHAVLLEWGEKGVKHYTESLCQVKAGIETEGKDIGALVMNCNPFTKGHRYLIETAAGQCDHVFVLVVEENVSRFPFRDRLELVKQGTRDLSNVTVLSGGRYAVSELTFPSYFTKEEKVADAHAAMDAEIFLEVIVPALGIKKRFIGTEPYSAVTNRYNEALKDRLPRRDVEVVELPRMEWDGQPISASRVRALLDEGTKEAWTEIQSLVPESTYTYLQSNCQKVTLMELLDGREARALHQRELLNEKGGVLVSMTLNIPGPVKDKIIYRNALENAVKIFAEKIGEEKLLHREVRHKKTGSEGYLVVSEAEMEGKKVKALAIAMEDGTDIGRLLDIDVMTPNGSFSRKDFGMKGRTCLLCENDAKVCARGQVHEMKDLLRKIEEILGIR